jgi:hypothetical protein
MPVTRVTPKHPGSVDHIQHSTRLCEIAVPAAPADARPLFLSARVRNSPANSMWVIVKNNEKYNAGEFRVQRQGRAPRAAANNNEYQCGQQWPGSWTPLLPRGSYSRRDAAQKKGPARSPVRAHQLSFNFMNRRIWV